MLPQQQRTNPVSLNSLPHPFSTGRWPGSLWSSSRHCGLETLSRQQASDSPAHLDSFPSIRAIMPHNLMSDVLRTIAFNTASSLFVVPGGKSGPCYSITPSSVIQAKKQRKTTESERLEISSRKLEIPREHFMQRWAQ